MSSHISSQADSNMVQSVYEIINVIISPLWDSGNMLVTSLVLFDDQ